MLEENFVLGNESLENLKQDIVNELNDYIEREYWSEVTLATIFADGSEDLTFRINISCHNLNL